MDDVSNEELKERVLDNFQKLISDMRAADISDLLIQERIISVEEWQGIEAFARTRTDINRAFLCLLLNLQNPRTFLVFKKALKKTESLWLQEILDQPSKKANLATFDTDFADVRNANDGAKSRKFWKKMSRCLANYGVFFRLAIFPLLIISLHIIVNYSLVKAQHDYAKQSAVVCSIRTKTVSSNEEQRIHGVALLKNELYIISRLSSTIEVYASTTCRYIRQFTVNELADPVDIVANVMQNTLFISHWLNGSGEILNIDVNGDLLTKWRTRQYFGHLFVTASYNIILSALKTNMFIEYTADGEPFNIVEADKDVVSYISHVAKLSNGLYLVSHGYSWQDPKHGVCIVDEKGRVVKSFGRSRGWTTQQMSVPYYLAVDRHGTVFVADSNNMRVMLLSSELEYKRILLSEKNGIRFPYRMALDETNGRLIIVDFELRNNELKNGQVLVFDILQK